MIKRLAFGIKADVSLSFINSKLEVEVPLARYIEAIKDDEEEEPVVFGPNAALKDFGSGWELQTVADLDHPGFRKQEGDEPIKTSINKSLLMAVKYGKDTWNLSKLFFLVTVKEFGPILANQYLLEIVIRALARVDVIDPALRRPGRFDAQVEVSTLTEEDHLRILKAPTIAATAYLRMAGRPPERVSNIACNIVNRECTPKKDQSAPVYITIGDGGNIEGLANIMTEPQPAYSAYREASIWQIVILSIKNRTHAYYAWHRNQDGYAVESDKMWFFNRHYNPVDDSTKAQQ
ncbi:hypothetical protein ACFE04_023117 [Oxalis oulophora]